MRNILHVGEVIPMKRIILSKCQRSILEALFAVQRYPTKTQRKELAIQTGLQELKIIHWFRHKREIEKLRQCGEYYHFIL